MEQGKMPGGWLFTAYDFSVLYFSLAGYTIPPWISLPLGIISGYETVKGVFGIGDFTLEYDSYSVTEMWTVTKPLEGYPGIYVRTCYTMEQCFYMNDTGAFELFDSVLDFTTETICIWGN